MAIQVSKFLSRRNLKWAKWLVGLFLFYTIVGFLILPPIVRSIAVKQLTKQFNREVTIQKVKLNPYTLSVTIRGLLIKDHDGQPFVSWDEVYVNFQISSLLGKTWRFNEISTTKPFIRAQMNKDYSFNFSDLITKFSTNAPSTGPAKPAQPLALSIKKFHIVGASASFTDLTTRTPFARIIGPLDVTLNDFRTDPSSKNPYAFAGTTDAGERFHWSGYFYLSPIRSEGELSLENLTLNKYAPLYQDFVKFNIKDGVADVRSSYRFELSQSNHVATVTNLTFALHQLKVGEPDADFNFLEQEDFAVKGASVDAVAHHAEVEFIKSEGGRLRVQRNQDQAINVVEASKPADTGANTPGGIVFLLRSVTNAVAMLLNSTNQWTGIIHEVSFHDGALTWEDFANTRESQVHMDQMTLVAKNISNLPGTNLTAELSIRWNTNGLVKGNLSASFLPPTVDADFAVDQLDLQPLDPYLESTVNLLIIGSKLGMSGNIQLRTPPGGLPDVRFRGDAWLDDFHTVDGVMGDDLLKWKSVRVSGIDATLNPQTVAIKEVAIIDATARLIIETNHAINLLTALHKDNTNEVETTNEIALVKASPTTSTNDGFNSSSILSTNAESMPKISIGSLVISNAQVQFTDYSLSPNVDLGIQQVNGTIANLTSDDMQHADVDLTAQVDGVGPVAVTGTINPLTKNQTTAVKIKIRNVDLTPTSPYVGRFAGYRLARGKFEADLDYQITDRKVKGANLITLDQFTFGGKVESPDATHLPVRLAVAILKDRSGKIVLDVPVEGSLDDPKFRIGKVVTRAILNIITKIATSPFSVLGAIFGGHGEEISYQEFAPGSSELLPPAKEKLDALVKGLYERPALQVMIDGSIDPVADRDGLRQLKLDKQLRTLKWLSLRKAEQGTTTPDQLTLDPDERMKFIRQLYRSELDKGEINLNATSSTLSNAVPTPVVALRSKDAEKGATLMTHGYNQLTGSFSDSGAAKQQGTAASPAKPVGVTDAMELALLINIMISDADFAALAQERAKAVRAYIIQTGNVEADRVFLSEAQAGVKSDGSRVYLQLQ